MFLETRLVLQEGDEHLSHISLLAWLRASFRPHKYHHTVWRKSPCWFDKDSMIIIENNINVPSWKLIRNFVSIDFDPLIYSVQLESSKPPTSAEGRACQDWQESVGNPSFVFSLAFPWQCFIAQTCIEKKMSPRNLAYGSGMFCTKMLQIGSHKLQGKSLKSLVSDDVFDLHTPPMERGQTSNYTREKRLLRKEKES